jgi:hypothetical protein
VTNTTRPPDAGGAGEVEALCAELVAELRDTVRLYQTTITEAARQIAARRRQALRCQRNWKPHLFMLQGSIAI